MKEICLAIKKSQNIMNLIVKVSKKLSMQDLSTMDYKNWKDNIIDSLKKHALLKTSKKNAMRCNNRDNLLQLSFTLKISIFLEAYI